MYNISLTTSTCENIMQHLYRLIEALDYQMRADPAFADLYKAEIQRAENLIDDIDLLL